MRAGSGFHGVEAASELREGSVQRHWEAGVSASPAEVHAWAQLWLPVPGTAGH